MSTSLLEHDVRQDHRHDPKPIAALAWGYNNAGGLRAAGSARATRPIRT